MTNVQVKELKEEIERLKFKLENEKKHTEEYRLFAQNIEMEKKLLEKQKQTIRSPKEGVIHTGYACKNCGVSPVRGKLFMCLECDNFVICEDCESKFAHEVHTMARLADKFTSLPAQMQTLLKHKDYSTKIIKDTDNKEIPGASKTTTIKRIKFLEELCGESDKKKIESLIQKYSNMNDIQFQDAALKDLGYN